MENITLENLCELMELRQVVETAFYREVNLVNLVQAFKLYLVLGGGIGNQMHLTVF